MAVQVNAIMIGVEDLGRSKKFYGDGLGCKIEQDFPQFVKFDLGDGSSSLALYERTAAAQDAGVSPEGSGFRGVSFHYIVSSKEEVDEAMAQAVAAGAAVVKEAAVTQWGISDTSATPMATSGRSCPAPEEALARTNRRPRTGPR
jgi:catechol 2,3-dioxygenase-like lactoylglutathione lyase family enzyme